MAASASASAFPPACVEGADGAGGALQGCTLFLFLLDLLFLVTTSSFIRSPPGPLFSVSYSPCLLPSQLKTGWHPRGGRGSSDLVLKIIEIAVTVFPIPGSSHRNPPLQSGWESGASKVTLPSKRSTQKPKPSPVLCSLDPGLRLTACWFPSLPSIQKSAVFWCW